MKMLITALMPMVSKLFFILPQKESLKFNCLLYLLRQVLFYVSISHWIVAISLNLMAALPYLSLPSKLAMMLLLLKLK